MTKHNKNENLNSSLSHKKVFIACCVLFALLIVIIVFFIIKFRSKSGTSDALSSVAQNNSETHTVTINGKTYDENNIGEVYCAPIDPEHIAEDEDGIMYADNEVLVVAAEGVTKKEIEDLAKQYDAEIVGYIEQTGDYQWKLSESKSLSELDELVDEISKNDDVSSCSYNSVFEVSEASVDYDINTGNAWEVNDPLGLTGAKSAFTKGSLAALVDLLGGDKAWGVEAINAPSAWTLMNLCKQYINPIKVGIIDNCFMTDHEDISFAKDSNGKKMVFPQDENGRPLNGLVQTTESRNHGTHVAGIMAATGSNSLGICGVYPYAEEKIYGYAYGAYSVSSTPLDSSSSSIILTDTMMEKVAFAELIFRNVKVINCSYGYDSSFLYYKFGSTDSIRKSKEKEIEQAAKLLGDFLNRAYNDGKGYEFVIVSSAGNESNNSNYTHDAGIPNDPDSGDINCKYSSNLNALAKNDYYPNIKARIIAVGAVDINLDKTFYSNSDPDIYAPGGTEEHPVYSSIVYNDKEKKYGNLKGTSMAAPHVAGICADVWSIDNNLTGKEVKDIVVGSTLDGITVSDNKGVADCYKAVVKAFDKLEKETKNYKVPKNGAALGWIYESNRETPIEGVKVVPYQDGNALDKLACTTDSFGHFELVVPAGEYTLELSKEGYITRNDLKVTIENGQVNYYNEGIDEVIALEKEMTEAEKYAKIVMENEDLWLAPLNEMNIPDFEDCTCWFEDINFDGTPEFIVGGFNMETQYVCYNVYVIENNKMRKLLDKGFVETYGEKGSQFPSLSLPGIVTSPNAGFAHYCCEVIQTNDKYYYLFPYCIMSYGVGYGITAMDGVDNDVIQWTNIGRFDEYPSFGCFDSNAAPTSSDDLISTIDEWNKASTKYWVHIGTIPCTYKNLDLDMDWFNKASSSDSGLNDSSASFVSGCYDTLTESEKTTALIKSYNTYNLEKTGSGSELLGRFVSDLRECERNANIKTSYKGIIDQKLGESRKKDPNMYDIEYALFDIDKNNTPELLINTGTAYGDHTISVYSFDPDSNVPFLVKEGIVGIHTSFYRDIDNDQIAIIMLFQGYGSIIRLSMSNGEIIENEHNYGEAVSVSDMGNFESIGLSYNPPLNYCYRAGYSDASLYDIIDQYHY